VSLENYWIYYAGRPVGCVRMPAGSSEQAVRTKALEWHDRLPLCDRPFESPSDRRAKLVFGQVRQFFHEGRAT
jgi:hypothetical protein